MESGVHCTSGNVDDNEIIVLHPDSDEHFVLGIDTCGSLVGRPTRKTEYEYHSVTELTHQESVVMDTKIVLPPNGDSVLSAAEDVSTDGGRNESSTTDMNSKPRDDLASVVSTNSDIPAKKKRRNFLSFDFTEEKLSEDYSSSYPTAILDNDLQHRCIYHRVIEKREFQYTALLGFGLANFMSYAAYFCKYEARNGAQIVSVGSGNGVIEKEIIATYRKHFAEEIKITLVDPNPDYEVDFKTTDDLLEERPNVVGNCIAFIIWPEPMSKNEGYDIDAIRKLQPLAALTVYDPTAVSGSYVFARFLSRKTNEDVELGRDGSKNDENYGLGNYTVEKVASQEVYFTAGKEFDFCGRETIMPPAVRFYSLRMMKLKRI